MNIGGPAPSKTILPARSTTTPEPGTVMWKSTPTLVALPVTRSTKPFLMLGASLTAKPVTEFVSVPRALPWKSRRIGSP